MIRQQSGKVGMHARQRDHVSCRISAARAVAVDLHDGVAAALGDFDKITDVPGLALEQLIGGLF